MVWYFADSSVRELGEDMHTVVACLGVYGGREVVERFFMS